MNTRDITAAGNRKLPPEVRRAEAALADVVRTPAGRKLVKRSVAKAKQVAVEQHAQRATARAKRGAERHARAERQRKHMRDLAPDVHARADKAKPDDGTVRAPDGTILPVRHPHEAEVIVKGGTDPETGIVYTDARATVTGKPYHDPKTGELRYAVELEDGHFGSVRESRLKSAEPAGTAVSFYITPAQYRALYGRDPAPRPGLIMDNAARRAAGIPEDADLPDFVGKPKE